MIGWIESSLCFERDLIFDRIDDGCIAAMFMRDFRWKMPAFMHANEGEWSMPSLGGNLPYSF